LGRCGVRPGALVDCGGDRLRHHLGDHGFIKSIYMFDPNGIRVELTTKITEDEALVEAADHAHDALKKWTEEENART
ncbi:MAG: hypothetical protein AAFW98_19905, partial [Pseudomonadota bacterium]